MENSIFTRINNDANGNPRYVCHMTEFLNDKDRGQFDLTQWYAIALKKARQLGGKKYHTKSYGGGIVFQSYNTDMLASKIAEIAAQ